MKAYQLQIDNAEPKVPVGIKKHHEMVSLMYNHNKLKY